MCFDLLKILIFFKDLFKSKRILLPKYTADKIESSQVTSSILNKYIDTFGDTDIKSAYNWIFYYDKLRDMLDLNSFEIILNNCVIFENMYSSMNSTNQEKLSIENDLWKLDLSKHKWLSGRYINDLPENERIKEILPSVVNLSDGQIDNTNTEFNKKLYSNR